MDLHVRPIKLPKKILNNLDIIRAISFEKQQWMDRHHSVEEPGISIIANLVAKQVQLIYRYLGIDIIRNDKVKQRVLQAFKCRQKLLKFPRTQRHTEKFSKKKELYIKFMSENFDVGRKRCSPIRKKKNVMHKNPSNFNQPMFTEDTDSSEDITADDKNDLDYVPSSIKPHKNKKRDLTEINEAQARYTASDRCTSAIVNATLRTYNIPEIIDKSKLRRGMKRKIISNVDQEPTFGGGIYYDSRNDLSLTDTKKIVENGKIKSYRRTIREDHYTIVSQPEGLFLGYVPIDRGDAKVKSQGIISFLKDKNMFDTLIALGCDGTSLNTGLDGGINHFIEVELERPLHWFVCMLHMNELPLKSLITKLDGRTSGASSFSGPIGKALGDVDSPCIVNYKRFDSAKPLSKLPEDVFKKLSNDQKYLYKIVSALISGRFPESLKQMKIGALNHSRWVTTASRICKLYALTENPSDILKSLTSYVVNIYAPAWFRIKKNELVVDGPKNVFFLMEKSTTIEDENVRKIVQESIQRNAYFAHSENLLLAQLSSKKKSERVNAVRKILEIRERIPGENVRRFKVPKLNFQAKNWTDIINYDSDSTEPPFTCNMNEEEIIALKQHPLEVPKFKCHTQMVERGVKEVTRVSLKAIDHNKRNSMVRATLIHRAKYPKLDSCKDHIIQNERESYQPVI